MFLRFTVIPVLFNSLLLFPALDAQHANRPPAAAQEHVVSLENARQAALKAGNIPAVENATRDYVAELFLGLARTEAQLGEDQEATESYSKSIGLRDSSAHRQEFGSFLLQSGRAADATVQYKRRVDGESTQDPGAWIALALAHRVQGNWTQAADSFEHALALKDDINVAYALGAALLQLHQQAKAETLFKRIFSAVGKDAVWHVAVGDAYRDARYYNEAAEQFRQALAIDPKALHAEFFLGLTYLQMNEWGPNSESFQHLRKAVAQSPGEYLGNFYLGALESTDGSDLPTSDAHLEAAVKADATQPEAWIYLGMNANREHKDVVAEQDFRKAIELTGTNEAMNNYQVRRAYFGLGRLLVANGKKEEGRALLEKFRVAEKASLAASSSTISSMGTTTLDGLSSAPAVLEGLALPNAVPKSTARNLTPAQRQTLSDDEVQLKQLIADAYNDLGTAQARQQNYADALQTFLTAEQVGNPSPTLLRNIGTAAFRLSNFAVASRALTQYMSMEAPTKTAAPAVQRAGLMLGFSDFDLGNFAAAATAFEQVKSATMADPRAAYSWSFSLARTSHAQESNRIADRLVAQPLPPEQLSLVCHVYVDNENYEGSVACYRKAYSLDPTLQLAHYEAGQALIHLDRPQEAVAELEQEIKLSPDNANVGYALAYALLQASRKEEAQTLLTTIVAAHPEQAEAQYQLGKLLLEQGKLEDAVAHLESSEKLNPAPDYVHYQLGVAYKKAGRQADSERELKQYRAIKDKIREKSAAQMPQPH